MKTVAEFKIEAGEKTYSGDFAIANDDGTSHLPMIVQTMMKLISEQCPEITQARKLNLNIEFKEAE